MIVLVYLISAPPSTSQGVSAHDRPNRILRGWDSTVNGDDDEFLTCFSKVLLGLEKEQTFDALHNYLPFTWDADEKYDTVNPFGDLRKYHDRYQTLWTIDTLNDMLLYTNAKQCSRIPLGLLRERAVSLADRELLGGPVPPPLECKFESETPYWKPQAGVDERMCAFGHRLLRDFNHQWRHILRNNYNSVTLRVLARGIIRLSTLDFEVRENNEYASGYMHAWITNLPDWEPFEADIVRVGSVWVILCQDIQNGLSMAQQHLASREINTTKNPNMMASREEHTHYMILSVKHIMLCHATDQALLKYTAPEALFNGDYGIGPPSDLALNYLIWAIASARPPIHTTIQSLPTEIQDIILYYSSLGTVGAAKIGCMLGLGSPFLWKDGSLEVTSEESYSSGASGPLVESLVCFDAHESGICYLPRAE